MGTVLRDRISTTTISELPWNGDDGETGRTQIVWLEWPIFLNSLEFPANCRASTVCGVNSW